MNLLYKLEELAKSRRLELEDYNSNIDTYQRAISKLPSDGTMELFKKELEDLIASTVYQRNKSSIMLAVLEDQIDEQS